VVIQDQIPIIQNADSKIETLVTDKAKDFGQTVIMKWVVKLKKKDSSKINFSY
jgi:hypothetical protein